MSEFASFVGKAAGVVAGIALIGSGIGSALGGTMVLAGVGSASSIASVAGAVAVAAQIGTQLTAKGPVAQGQINQRITGANNPMPYIMGRDYSGGLELHDVGWGGEVDDVKNPYRWLVSGHSCAGPLDGFEALLADFEVVPLSGTAATGYYEGWLWCDYQLGTRPEPDALTPQWAGAPGWGPTYKTSSWAAMGLSLLWSKTGERFAGGREPAFGAIWRGVRVYDPRLDDTYPGGAGACRLGDESTYVYSTDPALHAGMYAYGRYVEGKKVLGIDLGERGVAWADIVAWANLNDARSWSLGGKIYEPGNKWNNLKLICQAGGAKPLLAGGAVHFQYSAPRVAIGTIGRDDLAEGPLRGGRTSRWKTRHNMIVPRYRSEEHKWEYVQATAAMVAEFVADDGEEKSDEVQFDLVTDKDQATQLAAYEVWERREKGPYVVPCKPHMRDYQVGDCLTLLPELGLEPEDTKVLVKRKRFDFATGIVMLTLVKETDAKHADALGRTGTAPSVAYYPDVEDLDATFGSNSTASSAARTIVSPETVPVTAGEEQIEIDEFTGVLNSGAVVLFPDGLLTGLDPDTRYAVTYDQSAGSYSATEEPASVPLADGDNVLVAWISTEPSTA